MFFWVEAFKDEHLIIFWKDRNRPHLHPNRSNESLVRYDASEQSTDGGLNGQHDVPLHIYSRREKEEASEELRWSKDGVTHH